MHAGQVVTLEIVINISLPVALHVVSATLKQLHPGKTKTFGLRGKLSQALDQRLGSGIKIDEDQIEPFFGSHRSQRKLFGIESGLAFKFGGADERAVKPVGPTVIAATKQFSRTASLGGRSGAMAADVIETAQFALSPAHQQKRLAQNLGGEEVSGICQLIAMADHLPGPGEDSISLSREQQGIGVERRRNRPGAGNV